MDRLREQQQATDNNQGKGIGRHPPSFLNSLPGRDLLLASLFMVASTAQTSLGAKTR